ncbi:MAG: phenylalanine--tRNA ligase subunit alpha [Tissierellia bacterium]|nr:phenylalanine--tRNA ligase subunit alpha [Tissierellia bacterium]
MKDKLLELKESVINKIKEAQEPKALEEVRVKILGKKGELTAILRGMGKLSKEERPVIGQLANKVRDEIESALEDRAKELKELINKERIVKEKIDITADLKESKIGHRHPLYQTVEELENLFREMGFMVVDGPEIETVENNFTLLNFPEDHPSIGPSDTFYIDEDHLLRTHTSPVQIRYMKEHKPPIRMVSAGRTFRFDDVDDTHSPMFHQIEGLVVDKGVSMANLIETLNLFVKYLFGEDIETRFRPHQFPFTEPSAEVDVSCYDCKGNGCEKCNHTGWSMELLGCGMVHPNVLENCGIDSKEYSGFAFGMGIDRITMVKYGIDNIRLLYDNDKRFLEQF